jgi:competence protein ComEA
MSQPPNVPRPLAGGSSEFVDRLRALRGDARVGAALLACVAIAAGVAWFRAGIAPSEPAAGTGVAGAVDASDPTTTSAAITTTSAAAEIVIDVVGAVRVPGVVTLPAGARVVDAIRAAGGAAAAADLVRLNLAAPLADGTRVAVPRLGEPPPAVDPSAVTGSAAPSTGNGDPGSAGDGTTAGGPINVNTATADDLETLPGIGPTLAAAIVEDRERNGPFASVDDLNRVPGIGDGRLSQLRDLVTV